MTESNVKSGLEQAITQLFERQPNIFEFTSETGQTEWNLAHHLAVEVHECFPPFDCDLDVVKRNYGNRRPDIILHKRGTHEANFLVIEVKLDGGPQDTDDDIKKIQEHWFTKPLCYEFGAVINLLTDSRHEVLVFQNKA